MPTGKGVFTTEKRKATVDRTTPHDQEGCVKPWMSLSPK